MIKQLQFTLGAVMLCFSLCALAYATDAPYKGNHNSMIYHNQSCRYYDCKACTVPLMSPEQAREKGFRACKICGG